MGERIHQGGELIMKKTILTVPRLWADHHVLKVREVLAALNGINDVYASAAWKQVLVQYDGDQLDESAIVAALTDAGYAVSEELGLEGTRLSKGDPAWEQLDVRVTKTDQRDLILSGDFRRY
jgi:copper chaperone CopZ